MSDHYNADDVMERMVTEVTRLNAEVRELRECALRLLASMTLLDGLECPPTLGAVEEMRCLLSAVNATDPARALLALGGEKGDRP